MGKLKYPLMVALSLLVLSVMASSAAPSTNKNIEDKPQLQVTDDSYNPQRNNYETTDQENKHLANPDTQREKRWYNYRFPPFQGNPFPPEFGKETALANPEDPLTLIFRRLQDISSNIRQPVLPPPPPFQVPVILPIYVYFPLTSCNCQPSQTNDTKPGIDNRFPDMEDSRQNWGFFINETNYDDDGEDFTRPISFEPIAPNRTLSRPPPPVEHGSTQASANDTNQVEPGPLTTKAPPLDPPKASVPQEPPTSCDGAILSCCHQPQVTYECFSSLGCPDVGFGDPCEAKVIISVISKFQKFYEQNNT